VRTHVICIGDEILRGHTLNTNLAFIGEMLDRNGYALDREICIPDRPDVITAAVDRELQDADLVITTGGLGPTSDDVTRDAVAKALGLTLRLDQSVLESIRTYLAERGFRVPDEALHSQAMAPASGAVLPNRNGTAPGLWCASGAKAVVMLPGPPRELRPMFTESVLPRLREFAAPERTGGSLRICGLPESVAAERVETVLAGTPEIRPAYCAQPGGVDVHLTAPARSAEALAAALDRIRRELGAAALPDDCANVAEALGRLLLRRGWRLATAESCTGGGIAAAITENAGASDYFHGSVVTYANEWKSRLLNVKEATLDRFGAVSAETAREMLDGLLALHDVQAGIAVTGVAGPAGGSVEKPVGLVFVGTAVLESRNIRRCVFPGNRRTVRQRTVATALNQLRLDLLQSDRRPADRGDPACEPKTD